MIVSSEFHPPAWLRNPHLQTLWPVFLRRRPRLRLRRERMELPDGDFLDLDWTTGHTESPVVLVLHGLEGSVRSHYAAAIMRALSGAGYEAVLMHFRGCSGEPNRLARAYDAGETGDMAQVVETIRARHPGRVVVAIGYSLGGNALLKWLGETGADNPLAAAVAVSVPFRLADGARRVNQGLSRLYQWHLMGKMKAAVRRKQRLRGLNLELGNLRRLRSFTDFDAAVTAPLGGYGGAADYYARASSRAYLKGIARPTLIIHALDDPFMYPETVPTEDELSPTVRLELSPHGGHVGFVAEPFRLRGPWWLERRILAWLTDMAPPKGAAVP